MSEWVFETLVWQSAACLMEAAFGEDGRLPQTFARPLMAAARQADDSRPVSIGLSMARPVVGLGASASTYYPAVAAVMGTGAVIPEHAGVANAVGAVVGNVRVFARASVS